MVNKLRLEAMPDVLNARDIAGLLNIGYTKSLCLIKYSIPHLKIGNVYRVSKTNFAAWLNDSETKIIKLD